MLGSAKSAAIRLPRANRRVGRRILGSFPLVETPVVQEAIEKADLLIEAMGWIRRFRDKITVIKLGGSVMEDPTVRCTC